MQMKMDDKTLNMVAQILLVVCIIFIVLILLWDGFLSIFGHFCENDFNNYKADKGITTRLTLEDAYICCNDIIVHSESKNHHFNGTALSYDCEGKFEKEVDACNSVKPFYTNLLFCKPYAMLVYLRAYIYHITLLLSAILTFLILQEKRR